MYVVASAQQIQILLFGTFLIFFQIFLICGWLILQDAEVEDMEG